MSTEEGLSIDHLAIRSTGEVIAQSIGALAAQPGDRDATLDFLHARDEEIPYETLCAEYARLTAAIGDLDSQCQTIDETLATELQRLTSLASTIAKKMPKQLEAANAIVEQKKEAANEEAEVQKAEINTPRAQLDEELEQLTVTMESVSVAWPVAPYPPEALEEAIKRRTEMEAAAMEEEAEEASSPEPALYLEGLRARRNDIQDFKEKVLGPHAKLADSIPSLSERLVGSASEHLHAHDEIETARDVMDRAAAKPQAERTEEEDLLIKAVYVLKTRFLANVGDLRFLRVYEAGDVIELTKRLRKFSKKNRPDFDDLEGQILDKATTRIPLGGRFVPDDVKGAVERMQNDAPNRKGMTWDSLTKHASRACDTIRAKLLAGGTSNVHLKNYIIDVADRSDTNPDISWVYQFVADNFAFDVLATRRNHRQASNKEGFTQNCEIITAWLEEAQPLLKQLPKDFRLRRYIKPSRGFRRQTRSSEYENVTAMTGITNMVRDIRMRQPDAPQSQALRHKSVDFDPQGALNHQLRLGHMVNALKEELAVYDAPTEGRTEEIVPFA